MSEQTYGLTTDELRSFDENGFVVSPTLQEAVDMKPGSKVKWPVAV